MLRNVNVFDGLRKMVVVPLLVGLSALVTVDQANAFHKTHGHPHPKSAMAKGKGKGKVQARFQLGGLDYIGMTAIAGEYGATVTGVQDGSFTQAAGFEGQDVIQNVDGNPVATGLDLDAAITNALNAGQSSVEITYLNGRDFGSGAQEAILLLH